MKWKRLLIIILSVILSVYFGFMGADSVPSCIFLCLIFFELKEINSKL